MSQYDTLEQKAVALKYDETQNSAPVIVASGMDMSLKRSLRSRMTMAFRFMRIIRWLRYWHR